MERIDSKLSSGFRDFLPDDAAARQAMTNKIIEVFERFGFLPIDTPALEKVDVLTGADENFTKQLYRARITDTDEPLGLRFDLTVPMARFVAAHSSSLTFPFQRYHIGNVWRGEHAQQGRYRQFVQCDADIVGSKSVVADAQVIALVHAIFTQLGLGEKVSMRISHRAIMRGLPEFLGFPEDNLSAVLRTIDKMDKNGWDGVAAELKDKVGLDSQHIDGIQELLNIKGENAEAILTAADAYLKFTPSSHEGIGELTTLVEHLDALGVPRSAWNIDLSITRGLGYYTGVVFETSLTGMDEFGSVCSGGRYDNLVGRFSPLELSGVGMSIGLDRLFATLDNVGLLQRDTTKHSVALLDFDSASRSTVLALAHTLHKAGIAATLYTGGEETLKGQLSWAVKSNFPHVIIMGATEREKGIVQIKDMAARTQQEVSLGDVATVVSTALRSA